MSASSSYIVEYFAPICTGSLEPKIFIIKFMGFSEGFRRGPLGIQGTSKVMFHRSFKVYQCFSGVLRRIPKEFPCCRRIFRAVSGRFKSFQGVISGDLQGISKRFWWFKGTSGVFGSGLKVEGCSQRGSWDVSMRLKESWCLQAFEDVSGDYQRSFTAFQGLLAHFRYYYSLITAYRF